MELTEKNTENIIYKVKVGSHAYGTNVEGSDEDFKGVFIQSLEDIAINGYREQVNINKDETYYELRRFINLCMGGNPTMLELLYSPKDCILYKHPIFDLILEIKEKFLTKSCKYSFGGYAYAQIEKAKGLKKKMNWEEDKKIRKTVLDFCYVYNTDNNECKVYLLKDWLKLQGYIHTCIGLTTLPHLRYSYNIYYDHIKDHKSDNPKFDTHNPFIFNGVISDEETANDVCLSEVPEYYARNMCEGLLYFNKDEYSKHCKDYREYLEWLNKRNIQRYVDVEEHGQRIDGKNLLHCYRLIETGIEIAQQKTINVRRDNAEFLIEIRKGKHDLNKLLIEADNKIKKLNEAFDECDLPVKVDISFFTKLITKIRLEYAKNNYIRY